MVFELWSPRQRRPLQPEQGQRLTLGFGPPASLSLWEALSQLVVRNLCQTQHSPQEIPQKATERLFLGSEVLGQKGQTAGRKQRFLKGKHEGELQASVCPPEAVNFSSGKPRSGGGDRPGQSPRSSRPLVLVQLWGLV